MRVLLALVTLICLGAPAFGASMADDAASANRLMARGEWEEARHAYLRLHEGLLKSVGAERPLSAQALANACDASVPLAGRLDAKPLCLRALAVNERVSGRDAPETARVLSDLSLLYSAEGNLARAGELLERALRIAERDPASPDCAGLLNNLGFLYYRRGKYGRSREVFEKAIRVIESRPAANRSDLVTILGNLGTAELAAHDAPAAELHFQKALVEAERFFADDPAKGLKALRGLEQAEVALGHKAARE